MTGADKMHFVLRVWRQPDAKSKGTLVSYPAEGISPDMSFLEMLDVVNEDLVRNDTDPIAFEHDCREGICGCCSLVINGIAHGPEAGTTVCQLYMRQFRNDSTIVIEPFRSKAFPVIRDLVVDRFALDKIIAAGGFVSVNTGSAPDAHALPVPKSDADRAMDAAQCIGCGACVAACPNGSAMLFVAAKVSHLALLPQGRVEKRRRVLNMIAAMDKLGFGNCSNHYECAAACPKNISAENIARMNREFLTATFFGPD
jgi:succinate dehydrogenase / fumarate reductase, iron-sulfur subunit